MVLPDSHGVSRAPRYSGGCMEFSRLILRGFHPLWPGFPSGPVVSSFSYSMRAPQLPPTAPSTPVIQRLRAVSYYRFGLLPFRSPLLGESLLLSSPGGTQMFQFPPFALSLPDITPERSPCSDIPGSTLAWQLLGAFRSLPRLSSPPDALASSVRPFQPGLLS